MNAITICRLGAADTGIARDVCATLLREDTSREHLATLLVDDRNILIAALAPEEVPVGFLIAHRFPALDGRTLVYLYDILVIEAHRRQGIASAMVSRLRQICLEDGVNRIWVGSSRDNHEACGLWTRLGAQRVSEAYAEFTFELSNPTGQGMR